MPYFQKEIFIKCNHNDRQDIDIYNKYDLIITIINVRLYFSGSLFIFVNNKCYENPINGLNNWNINNQCMIIFLYKNIIFYNNEYKMLIVTSVLYT